MAKDNIKAKKGFTIIEVVLVLAIAGLIFLMVFVALPALQRSQRDTQRRDDMARFLSQLAQYQANNNGKVPSEATGADTDAKKAAKYNDPFIAQYLLAGGDTFQDPSSGETYNVVKYVSCGSGGCTRNTTPNSAMGEITVYSNAKCSGEEVEYIQGNRKIAITLNLEGAGIYCGNN